MSSESQKKAIENFKKNHNWTEYCNQARKRRIERLKEEGVLNPYAVASNGEKPKYDCITKVKSEGRVLIPYRIREKFNIQSGDRFKISIQNDKIILEKLYE